MERELLTISYFSYKGGSGRSSLAYNTIPFLVEELNASSEHPIIVVDLDVDSAGLSFLLASELINGKEKNEIQYLTTNALIDRKNNIFNYPDFLFKQSDNFKNMSIARIFYPIGNKFGLEDAEGNESILFIPANPKENVSKFDESSNDRIEKFVQTMRNYNAAAIIFDMPSGDQLLGKVVMQECNKLVLCMRITSQHIVGTQEYLERKIDSIEGITFIPVPNAVPQEEIYITGRKFNFDVVKENIYKSLDEIINKKSENVCDFGMFEDGYFGIPEVKRFKCYEGILFRDVKRNLELSEDEKKAYDAYQRVAKIIVKE